MRVLRVDLPGGPLELHPCVTVVRGLGPVDRAALVEVFAELPRGAAPRGGLVEAHGVLLPLTPDTLELLDLRDGPAAVVRAADLPGAAAGGEAVAAVRDAAARERDELAAAEAALAAARRRLEVARRAGDAVAGGGDPLAPYREDAEALAAAAAEAEAAHEQAADAARRAALDADGKAARAEAARRRRQAAVHAVASISAELAQAVAARDLAAEAALAAAEARLAAAEAAAGAAVGDQGAGQEATASAGVDDGDGVDLDALRAERLQLEAALVAADATDPFPVRFALERLHAAPPGPELVPDPAALEVAQELAEVETGLADWERTRHHRRTDPADRARALARLERAEATVAALEAADQAGAWDSDPELEAAHAAVLEAREATRRRFGRARAARRLAEAEAAEAAALARGGYDSWSDYLARSGAGSAERARKLQEAREELEAAAAAVRHLDEAMAEELRVATLLDRRRVLREEAMRLLGDGDHGDLVAALRARRIPAAETGPVARLRGALEQAGVAVGDEEVDAATLAELAETWLAEQERAGRDRDAVSRELVAVETRIAAAEHRERLAAGSAAGVPPSAIALAALDECRAALAAARERVARARDVEAFVEERRRAVADVMRAEDEAIEAVAAAEATALEARAAARAAEAARAEAAERAAAARSAAGEAADRLARLEAAAATGGAATAVAAERREAEEAVALAERAVEVARADVDSTSRLLADLEAGGGSAAGGGAGPVDVEAAEWALLARVAAQRALPVAGALPLLLDDALAPFAEAGAHRLLDRLERTAAVVQVVVVGDDPALVAWVAERSPELAAVATVGGG